MSKSEPEDVTRRLERFKTETSTTDANKELIEQFINYLRAENETTPRRRYKYVYLWDAIFKHGFIDFDLETATRDEMREAVGRMQASDKSGWTIYDYKIAIKRFYSTLWEDKENRPKNIQRILDARFMKMKTPSRKYDVEALDPEEVMAMVEAAKNKRDKCLIFLLFESGARISECLGVTLGDVSLEQKYADVTFETKKNDKGPRTLTLTDCVGILQQWIEQHPDRDNDNAPLFVNIREGRGSHRGEPMQHPNANRILKEAAKDASIDKRVTPHVMRHSAATYFGRTWGINRLMFRFGWKDPDTARTYLHENEARMKQDRLAEKGITEETEDDPLSRNTCGRCGETWPPTQKYCGQCSLALDKETAEFSKNLENSLRQIAQEQVKGNVDEDQLKTIIEQKLA